MDIRESLKQLGDRVIQLKDQIQTEEATKNAFIMPFFQILGYDVFNPLEVVPEHTCDVGTKKGEKIDYAIIKEGDPILLVECKHWNQNLTLHDNQLLRYFGVSKAKFALLTNGVEYRFYTDLESTNVMDKTPFLEVNITALKDNHIEEIKKFHKSNFNEEAILDTATDLKYTNDFRKVLEAEFNAPSEPLVRLLAKQVYSGTLTAKYIEYFTPLMKKSFNLMVSDIINSRLNAALKTEQQVVIKQEEAIKEEVSEVTQENKVVTTEEELHGFYIVKSITRPYIASDRITYRDAQTYFAIFIDDNNRKPVCRLYFNSENNKQIGLIGEDKKEVKYKITNLDDIFEYQDQLKEAVLRFL